MILRGTQLRPVSSAPSHDVKKVAANQVYMWLVWLRMLEYFEGILFLTTNRNSDFDEAFQSRIHLKIRLPELGPQERTQIWRDRLCSGQNASAWTADIFKTLAKLEINVWNDTSINLDMKKLTILC